MPSKNIFTTEITQLNGTKTSVISSQALSTTSNRINTTENHFLLWIPMALSYTGDFAHPNSYLNLRSVRKLIFYRYMVCDIWTIIFTFLPGFTRDVGEYALSIQQPSFFKLIGADPSVITNAAIIGEEETVLTILNADPSYLLRKAKVKNSVGVEFDVTPLQAAVIATDVQLIENMGEHFKNLRTDLSGKRIDGLLEVQKQILQIYKKSLHVYLQKQEAKIMELEVAKSAGKDIDENSLKEAILHVQNYSAALKSNNLQTIIDAHNKAQEHNAFDFKPYVDAIINASDAELDAVMELMNAKTQAETATAIARTGVAPKESDAARTKSFDDLTLVEKLNRFREKLVEYMQQEIIFNPNHILTGLKWNREIRNAVDAMRIADPDNKKRIIIFSQLAGMAQRNAAEPVKQDIRQGTYYLTEKKRHRTRPSHFNKDLHDNIVRNPNFDMSLVDSSVVDGLGYKFAAGRIGFGYGAGSTVCTTCDCRFFKTYIDQKQNAWKTYALSICSQDNRLVIHSEKRLPRLSHR